MIKEGEKPKKYSEIPGILFPDFIRVFIVGIVFPHARQKA